MCVVAKLSRRTTGEEFAAIDAAVREATDGELSVNCASYPAVTDCPEQIWCVGDASLPSMGDRLFELEVSAAEAMNRELRRLGISKRTS